MMISTAEADRILEATRPDWGEETVPLAAAGGRVLRVPVVADRPAPPGNRVSMDGIAIRYADWAGGARRFRIQGFQPAGSEPMVLAVTDEPGCLEIATGSILVGPADTVIPVERLTIADGYAVVAAACEVERGQNVHLAGKDHAAGAALLPAGLVVMSARLAVLASVGMVQVPVARRPRVLVAATGDELIQPSGQPEAWQLRASNGPAITAALQAAGYDSELHHWPDSEAVLTERIGGALTAYDVLIFSGGISAGKKDYLKPVCEGLGVDFQFFRVQQRPGKPFAYGIRGNARVFCLPGNPVSALAGLHRYVLPELLAIEGRPDQERFVTLVEPFRFAKPLAFFLPVRLQDGHGVPCPPNGSGDWATPARADGIVDIPADMDLAETSQPLRYFRYW